MIDWNDEDRDERCGGAAEDDGEPWALDADAWRAAVGRSRPWSEPAGAEGWRGEHHLEEWPEWNAGPEYHMWKRLADADDQA